jgi:VWFA-related protein
MTRHRSNTAGIFLLLAVALAGAIAADPVAPQRDTAASKRFRLDVVASSEGKPAVDLKPADLELVEDGRKVPIRSLEFVPAGSEKRLVVVLHDMNLWIKNVQRDKDELSTELVALVRSGISLMIVRLDSPGGLKVLQPYTRDEELIGKVVTETLRKTGINESYEDLGNRSSETVSGTADSLLLSYYFDKRQRFERAIGGLLSACSLLGAEPGRKSVLLVSGGIPDISSSSRTDIERAGTATLDDRRATMDAIHERARQTTTQTRLFDPFGLLKDERFEQGDQVLGRFVQFANAMNVAFYALDPGVFTKSVFTLSSEFARPEATESESIQAETRAKEVQTLRDVADGTGGRLFRGSNKFEDMKKSIAADLEGYTVLSFRSETQKPDGKYHRLEVKPVRPGLDLLARAGYREVPAAEGNALRLISAYYSPDVYRGVPFDGLFAPVYDDSGQWRSWIGLALPAKPLFVDIERKSSSAEFSLYISVKDRDQAARAFTGKLNIPVRLTDSQRESLARMTSLWSYFKGPDLAPSMTGYDAVFVIQDPDTGEIGGWNGTIAAPDLKRDAQGAFLSAVLGSVASNPNGKAGMLSLDSRAGVLDFNDLRFFPRVTNLYTGGQDAWVFLQAHFPLRREKDAVAPQFLAFREDGPPLAMTGKLVSEIWNAKAMVWSGIFRLALGGLEGGAYALEITFPAWREGSDLTAEVKLVRGVPER